jgi:predicted TIM-barrel fold metal-dependent hydrolase
MVIPCVLALTTLGAPALHAQEPPTQPEESSITFPVVDLHTHMFNLKYLPVEGIAFSKSESYVPIPFFNPLVKAFVYLLNQSKESSYVDVPIYTQNNNEVFKFNEFEPESLEDDFDILVREPFPDRSTWTPEQLKMKRKIEKLKEKEVLFDSPMPAVEGFETEGVLGDVDEFYVALTGTEVSIKQRLDNKYTTEVGLYVHHMMDMQMAYADRPHWNFSKNDKRENQNQRMQSLAETFPGEIVTFTAYDPFRRDKALDTVKEAMKYGALGVKFYPPSGYQPSGNKIKKIKKPHRFFRPKQRNQYRSRYKRMDDAQLNGYIREFFKHCANEGIPVFVHCTNHGVEAAKDYGLFADPEFYVPILEEFKDLILCFGHSGSYKGWTEKEDWTLDDKYPGKNCKDHISGKSFAQKVAELCMTYKNVYCELDNHSEFIGQRPRVAKRIKRLIDVDKAKFPYHFEKKMMYGTDWPMAFAVVDPQAQLDDANALFDEAPLTAIAPRLRHQFFAANAIDYLDLQEFAESNLDISEDKKNALLALVKKINDAKPTP